MVSSLATSDIAALTSSGVTVTPEEVIRLNDLAVKVERASDAANVCEAPRVAWAGETPIYQRTLAGERWFNEFAVQWWRGDSLLFALAWTCAHGTEPGFFDAYKSEKVARTAIKAWWHGLACTRGQLSAALSYAMRGDLDYEQESEADEVDEEATANCPYTALVNQAISCGLGVTVAELGTMPPSRINDILQRWARNQAAVNGGSSDGIAKQLKESAQGRYFKYLTKLQARIPANGNG